jgi:hypothetical protein
MNTTEATRTYCHLHMTWDDECKADIAILSQYGSEMGPRYGDVQCQQYDEHRQNFRRVNVDWLGGYWHCDYCHEDDYKHGDDGCEQHVKRSWRL